MDESEIDGLPEKAKNALRKVFTSFDGSIALAKEKLMERKIMSFLELAKDMGYVI